MIKAKRISATEYNTMYHTVGSCSENVMSTGISGKSLARSIDVELLTKWRKMTNQMERVLQYSQPKNVPIAKAGIACQGLRCITAKINADHRIALAGEICSSIPLSIIPLQRNSSHSGARIVMDKSESTKGESLRSISNILFILSGMGMKEVSGSISTEMQRVARPARRKTVTGCKEPKEGLLILRGSSRPLSSYLRYSIFAI